MTTKTMNTFTVYMVNTDTRECTFHSHIQARTLYDAYILASDVEDVYIKPTLEDVDEISLSAAYIAKAAARRALLRGMATDTERTIYRDWVHAISVLKNYPTAPTAADIQRVNASLDPLSQEYYSIAIYGLYLGMNDYTYIDDETSGEDLHNIYSRGFKEISDYIRAERTNHANEVSTEYTMTEGKELVSISAYVAKMVSGTDPYTPYSGGGDLTKAETERLAKALCESIRGLTAVQKKTVIYLFKRKSFEDIARIDGVSKQSVEDRVQAIREKVGKYFEENAEEFLYIIRECMLFVKANEIKRKEGQTEKDNRRNTTESRKEYQRKREQTESRKEYQREYKREYMKKKREAEKQAKQN